MRPGALDRVALGDVLVRAQDHRADRVALEVEREAERVARELEHLALHRVGQAVDAADAVGDRDDRPLRARPSRRVSRFWILLLISSLISDGFSCCIALLRASRRQALVELAVAWPSPRACPAPSRRSRSSPTVMRAPPISAGVDRDASARSCAEALLERRLELARAARRRAATRSRSSRVDDALGARSCSVSNSSRISRQRARCGRPRSARARSCAPSASSASPAIDSSSDAFVAASSFGIVERRRRTAGPSATSRRAAASPTTPAARSARCASSNAASAYGRAIVVSSAMALVSELAAGSRASRSACALASTSRFRIFDAPATASSATWLRSCSFARATSCSISAFAAATMRSASALASTFACSIVSARELLARARRSPARLRLRLGQHRPRCASRRSARLLAALLAGGEAVGDLLLARLDRAHQRRPDELRREPDEGRERDRLHDQRQVDVHDAPPDCRVEPRRALALDDGEQRVAEREQHREADADDERRVDQAEQQEHLAPAAAASARAGARRLRGSAST